MAGFEALENLRNPFDVVYCVIAAAQLGTLIVLWADDGAGDHPWPYPQLKWEVPSYNRTDVWMNGTKTNPIAWHELDMDHSPIRGLVVAIISITLILRGTRLIFKNAEWHKMGFLADAALSDGVALWVLVSSLLVREFWVHVLLVAVHVVTMLNMGSCFDEQGKKKDTSAISPSVITGVLIGFVVINGTLLSFYFEQYINNDALVKTDGADMLVWLFFLQTFITLGRFFLETTDTADMILDAVSFVLRSLIVWFAYGPDDTPMIK